MPHGTSGRMSGGVPSRSSGARSAGRVRWGELRGRHRAGGRGGDDARAGHDGIVDGRCAAARPPRGGSVRETDEIARAAEEAAPRDAERAIVGAVRHLPVLPLLPGPLHPGDPLVPFRRRAQRTGRHAERREDVLLDEGVVVPDGGRRDRPPQCARHAPARRPPPPSGCRGCCSNAACPARRAAAAAPNERTNASSGSCARRRSKLSGLKPGRPEQCARIWRSVTARRSKGVSGAHRGTPAAGRQAVHRAYRARARPSASPPSR